MGGLQKVVIRQGSVKKSSDQRAFSFWFVLVASTLLVVALFSVATTQAYLVKSQQDIDEVRQEIREARVERARLQRQVDTASAPQSIIDRADDLGMVPSGEPTHLQATRSPNSDPLPAPPQGVAEAK